MKRAQKPEQKDQRRKDILEKAREYRTNREYRAIKLQDIADSLGLVKGTLYRYFPTKQDLFMELYRDDLMGWLAEWSAETGNPIRGIDDVAERWTRSLVSNPGLVRMIGSFHTDIERDLSEDGLLSFKLFIRDFFIEASAALEAMVPSAQGKGFEIIMGAYILIQGCVPLCYPSERIETIVRDIPELAMFRFSFGTLFPPLLAKLVAPYR